ncbi:MAG: class I tRNA ligase family protein, partial [Actinomycetota bacterium]
EHAYRVEGDVYFRVNSVDSYGRLGRLGRDEMVARESEQDGTTVDDPRKEDALDFPLWLSASEGPSWESPWGPGRPGWHIECSTLALKHLGKQVDIHGGGTDLIFPHHEAEIVQAEAVTGVTPFARFWVHVEMALCDGEKMSKSKGNMVFVRDVLEDFAPDGLRLYLLLTHYRRPLDFDRAELEAAATLASKLAEAARPGGRGAGASLHPDPFIQRLDQALDDDLDTPEAIAALDDLATRILAAGDAGTYAARRALRRLVSRLGLSLAAMK